MTIDEFINRAAKPIMVYRYARADTRRNSGAQKRMLNAAIELDELIYEYCFGISKKKENTDEV